jgi:hypothetical protein
MYPASIIINLDSSKKKGSHWVAAYIKSKDIIYYFDSYGPLNCILAKKQKESFCLTQPNLNIYNFLSKYKSITTNKLIFQSMFSDSCAHYCIYFIYNMSNGITFERILKILNSKPDPNEFVRIFYTLLRDE